MQPNCINNFKGLIFPWEDREDCEKCDYWISCQNETIKINNREDSKFKNSDLSSLGGWTPTEELIKHYGKKEID